MTKMAQTPIVINFDADVIFPPIQLYKAVQMIRSGEYDFVYPYTKFARVPRNPHRKALQKHLDIGILALFSFKGMEDKAKTSYGGAVVYNKEKFIEAGMENENFKNWGREDFERIRRFKKLGYNTGRVSGNLYHIDHVKGDNSTRIHAHYRGNESEYMKVRDMSKEELLKYVESWQWRKDALSHK